MSEGDVAVDVGGATLVNLTPHPVDVVLEDGGTVVIPPLHPPARVAHAVLGTAATAVGGRRVAVKHLGAGSVADLPSPRRDTIFIVSRSVALACPGRRDLVFPYDLVRDERGAVVGCRAFAVLSPA